MTIFVNLFDIIGAALAGLFLLILAGLALWVKFDNWRFARAREQRGPFAIRNCGSGQWLCYCSTTGEPVLREGNPMQIGAEIFESRARAYAEYQNVHPCYALRKNKFEVVKV